MKESGESNQLSWVILGNDVFSFFNMDNITDSFEINFKNL